MPPRRRKRPEKAPSTLPAPGSPAHAALKLLGRRSRLLSVLLVALASIRIVATYTVFNHTRDEPDHIACGIEWLDKGTYKVETQHPPLARVAAVVFPYLAGSRAAGRVGPPGSEHDMQAEGLAVLYGGHRYDLTLALARLGILPFFWVACFVVFWWGKRYFGPPVAVTALFAFTFLPPVLAHAGLATTDMALTAFLGACFVAGAVWLERPTVRHAAWFGLTGGLAVLSKFSALPFFPAAAGVALLWYVAESRPNPRELARAAWERVPTLLLAFGAAGLILWAGYRFSFGAVDFTGIRVPAPELFKGIQEVLKHNEEGHLGYLLGELRSTGWWYYYPVALAVKTPLGFLLPLLGAIVLAARNRGFQRAARLPLAFVLGILMVGAFSRINIGTRHVLPVYIGFSLLAAAAAIHLFQAAPARKWTFYGVCACGLWFAASSLWSHPDYLAYFNALAGDEPEKVLVDSDLDWGQDVKRLSKRLREAGAKEVYLAAFVNAEFEAEHGLPPSYQVYPQNPGPGWNAVGVSYWKELRLGLLNTRMDVRLWPDRFKPLERVGKTILLYYFPPQPVAPGR
jgi:hypothetical protein